MSQDLNIRRANPDDAAGLAACLRAAYAEFVGRIPDLPDFSADVSGEIQDNLVWVATSDGGIVGGLVLSPRDEFMLLANVAVIPETRASGLGKQLFVLAETETAKRGLRELRLATHREMADTIALYRRNGWVETSRIGNKVKMRKILSDR